MDRKEFIRNALSLPISICVHTHQQCRFYDKSGNCCQVFKISQTMEEMDDKAICPFAEYEDVYENDEDKQDE